MDADSYRRTAFDVRSGFPDRCVYAGAETFVACGDAGVTAVAPAIGVAYRSDAGDNIWVLGDHPVGVGVGMAVAVREVLRSQLHAAGWALVRASVVVNDEDDAILAVGSEGKSTVALTLAVTGHWRLLADSRVFTRPDGQGNLALLPWAEASAWGVGLLDACGLSRALELRLRSGRDLYPTTDPSVTKALQTGDISDGYDSSGRELKVSDGWERTSPC